MDNINATDAFKMKYFCLTYHDRSKKYGLQFTEKYILTQDRQIIDINENHLFNIQFDENELKITYIGNTETGFSFKAALLEEDKVSEQFRGAILNAGAMMWLLAELETNRKANLEKIKFYGAVMNDAFAKANFFGIKQPVKKKTAKDVWAAWKK